jgi:phosphoenolpyruvate-protein phosphotransferase/dihydroxyacetone kinase phosphotransfer subunit
MVGIVVVSHSAELASGVIALAREMSGPSLRLEAAGGFDNEDPTHPALGTDAGRVLEAVQRAMSDDGVLILMDLGSALMSAEFAVEMLGDDAGGPVRLSGAPLVEGAVAAAVAAAGGASLDEVAAEAGGALAMKAAQVGDPVSAVGDAPPSNPDPASGDAPTLSADPASGGAPASAPDPASGGAPASAPDPASGGAPASAPDPASGGAPTSAPDPASGGAPASALDPSAPDARAELPVRNEIGLHARPAARFVAVARGFDADVRVAKNGRDPVSARSLTGLMSLGARLGDTLVVTASGPAAADAVAALEALAAEGFGDGVTAAAPGAAAPAATAPGAATTGAATPGAVPREISNTCGEKSSTVASPPASGDLLSGVGASAGIAIGPARSIAAPAGNGPPPARAAGDAATEGALLDDAIAAARTAIEHDRTAIATRAGAAEAEIFDAHLALLDDDALLEPARAAIEGGQAAETAWYHATEHVAAVYRALAEPLLAERATDVVDVGRRVLAALAGPASFGRGTDAADATPGNVWPPGEAESSRVIVIADELTPADAARLDPDRVLGIVTARGSATAHAAILARALGLPAVVGLGDAVLGIADATTLLLDGAAGTVTVDPDPALIAAASERRTRDHIGAQAAAARAHEPAVTTDGVRIEVFANLGSTADARRAVDAGAEGVGLLRTEFLFLDRATLPDEDEQTEQLTEIATALDGRPLIVRTLDAGADKPLPALPMPAEQNPFLGIRGIRLSLARPELLATQLRAALRVAGAGHPLKLMLPMVATLEEITATQDLLKQARTETGVDAPLPLGIMVEIPAAALTAARLAPHVDFFSIGTNDLTQYTMAAERGDARLATLLDGPQPAVLRLVHETVRAATAHDRWVGVCGELAGDPAAAVLLAGLGVTELSMAPGLIASVKQALRSVSLTQARAVAIRALDAESADAARALARALW